MYMSVLRSYGVHVCVCARPCVRPQMYTHMFLYEYEHMHMYAS